ncbi:MAG: SDR family oxidoreductase [Prevotellaceae bacterium]|jgi:short-subunit dehydrogenase|nr:SDR family oxidoreductase [Prevotellaceae bacterium]
MSSFKNKNVLITGGASGIGKIMSRLALQRGANVIVWDVNQKGLDDMFNEFVLIGNIHTFHVDIAQPSQIKAAVEAVKREFGYLDILINNAGVVTGKYFHEHSDEEILRSLGVNTYAPMLITRLFLDGMLQRNRGHICNIASMASMISVPKMAAYVASKWAIMGWSDSLRLEMEQLNKNIHVTTVAPYYIDTGMFNGVKAIIPLLKPEKTAAKVIRAIERNRIYKGMPWSYNSIRLLQGILPVRLFDRIVGRWMGMHQSMKNFVGKNISN